MFWIRMGYMAISKSDIEHLKNLARVEFGNKETEGLVHDLGKILEYVDMLRSVDVAGAAETTHAISARNVSRADTAAEDTHDSATVAELIAAFPETEGNLLKVKNIL